uniref:tRNA pseudouridine synthase n=1 Tax=Corethron hystrix TaxID=216773 RepID=A0A7S1BMP1_9STRA
MDIRRISSGNRVKRSDDPFVRYALAIQYNGGRYLGFSRQRDVHPNVRRRPLPPSVESRIACALDSLTGDEGHRGLEISSRTDRGVHALWNVAHVDVRPRPSMSGAAWDPRKLQGGINHWLKRDTYGKRINTACGDDVRVVSVARAPSCDWSARYHAIGRTYIYRILACPESSMFGIPFEFDRAWIFPGKLDIDAMNEAAKTLVGTHDFSSF